MSNDTTSISFYLKSGTIRLYKKAVLSIGPPRFIRFRIREDGASLIVEPYDKITLRSFRVPKDFLQINGSGMLVHSKSFCRVVAKQFNWDVMKSYRIDGIILEKKHLVVFDLTNSKQIRI